MLFRSVRVAAQKTLTALARKRIAVAELAAAERPSRKNVKLGQVHPVLGTAAEETLAALTEIGAVGAPAKVQEIIQVLKTGNQQGRLEAFQELQEWASSSSIPPAVLEEGAALVQAVLSNFEHPEYLVRSAAESPHFRTMISMISWAPPQMALLGCWRFPATAFTRASLASATAEGAAESAEGSHLCTRPRACRRI